MNNWNLLLVAAAANLPVASSVLSQVGRVVAIPAGILLIFVVPGYALAEAIRPRASGRLSTNFPEGPVRIAFILGLSIAVTIVLGLLLNATTGLTRMSWAIGLGAFTIVASIIALLRRGERTVIDAPSHIPIGSLALFLLAVFVSVAAVTADVTGAWHMSQPAFTQLWILPSNANSVQVGVTSHEKVAARYSLVLHVRAATVKTWSFNLPPGAQWRARVKVNQDRSVPAVAVLRCSLYPHTTYRKVYLWPSQS